MIRSRCVALSVSPILKASLLQDALYTSYALEGLGGRYCEGLAALTHGLTADELTMLGTLTEASSQTCHNADKDGRAAGEEITAAAQAYSAASTVAAKKTAYTTTTM